MMMKKYMITAALALSLTGFLGGCGSSEDIGQDKAEQIAFEDAGTDESQVSHFSISKDRDNGKTYYEIQFLAGNTEYEYEIAASNGEIISSDYEIKGSGQQPSAVQNTNPPESTPVPPDSDKNTPKGENAAQNSSDASSSGITMDEAKQAALERVPGASESDLRIELEHDDGQLIYEGEIHYNRMEYEFEIDANTGSFLKWSEDH